MGDNCDMNQLNNEENLKETININKHILAEKLKSGELECDDLNYEEIDEMIKFFSDDIKEKDREIEKIKEEILEIKRMLNT